MTWDRLQSRRAFLTTAAASGWWAAQRGIGSMWPRAPWTLYVGTYTKSGTSKGIYRVAVDPVTLQFGSLELAAETSDPSFLALTPDGHGLVAVNELTTFGGQPTGTVSAFARDAISGALTRVGAPRASGGAAPCYVSMDRTGRQVLVANYVSGTVAVLPLDATGALREATTVQARTGAGPHPVRQTGPHAHCIVPDLWNRHVLMTDLGTDIIHVARLDASNGTLMPAEVPKIVLRPGAGPRHLAFSPDGHTLYVVTELDSTIVRFAYHRTTGALTEQQRVSTRPPGASAENFPAELQVHPTGHTVYASNRGDDTIAVFAVDRTNGQLQLVQTMPTGGSAPRSFTLTPDGTGLLVANQRADSILAFHVNALTGELSPSGQRIEAPVPVCLRFA